MVTVKVYTQQIAINTSKMTRMKKFEVSEKKVIVVVVLLHPMAPRPLSVPWRLQSSPSIYL